MGRVVLVDSSTLCASIDFGMNGWPPLVAITGLGEPQERNAHLCFEVLADVVLTNCHACQGVMVLRGGPPRRPVLKSTATGSETNRSRSDYRGFFPWPACPAFALASADENVEVTGALFTVAAFGFLFSRFPFCSLFAMKDHLPVPFSEE